MRLFHRFAQLWLVTLCSFVPCQLFAAEETSDGLERARHEAEAGQYDSALSSLQRILAKDSLNFDARLLRARVHAWSKDYQAAGGELRRLAAKHPENAEVHLAQGYLYYYQSQWKEAKSEFTSILSSHPDDEDAQKGLATVRDAERNILAWRVDGGLEFSNFSRRTQTSWNDEFLQVTRFFRNGTMAVHGHLERIEEFSLVDLYYEAGMDQRFAQRAYGYAYAGGTPDPHFRPTWRLGGGGGVRVNSDEKDWASFWILLDTRYDVYSTLDIGTVAPGIRMEHIAWAIDGSGIGLYQSHAKTLYGWRARLEGPLPRHEWSFYLGAANSPETVIRSTVNTFTLLGGISADIGPRQTIRLGYTRDDRENSYIRHAINVSFAQRF